MEVGLGRLEEMLEVLTHVLERRRLKLELGELVVGVVGLKEPKEEERVEMARRRWLKEGTAPEEELRG